jgi:uncharacterized protein YidB (DUF937 family)
MGLLDSLLGAAMQNMAGGQGTPGQGGAQGNPMAGALMALLTGGSQMGGQMGGQPQAHSSGGLAGLVSGLMGGGGAPQNAFGGGAAGMGGGALATGLVALVQQFSQNGYEQQAKSWVGTGANMPIDPQALNKVFGQDRLSMLAQQYGIPREELAAALAEQLPQAVNELTPQGAIPEPSAMEQLLAQFTGGGRQRGF